MIRILVPLDGSQPAEQALFHAGAIARSFKTRISLLQVIADSKKTGDVVVETADRRLQAAQAKCYLKDVAGRLIEQGLNVSTFVELGRPADEIVKFVRKHKVDLLCLTAFGEGGVTGFVHGSTVHKVISGVGTSILLVRPDSSAEPGPRYQKLLVPLDGSYLTDWALRLATAIAQAHDAELALMQVVETPKVLRRMPTCKTERELVERLVDIHKRDAEHHLNELQAQLPAGMRHSRRVVVAEEASQIIETMAASEDASLLVLAAHGLSEADSRLYGPVSESLLTHCRCPVLVLQDNLPAQSMEIDPKYEPLVADA